MIEKISQAQEASQILNIKFMPQVKYKPLAPVNLERTVALTLSILGCDTSASAIAEDAGIGAVGNITAEQVIFIEPNQSISLFDN